jgi:hypothetical protein
MKLCTRLVNWIDDIWLDIHVDSKGAVHECKDGCQNEKRVDFLGGLLDHGMLGDFMSGAENLWWSSVCASANDTV